MSSVIDPIISSNKIVIFSGTYCPYCTRVKQFLSDKTSVPQHVIEFDRINEAEANAMRSEIVARFNHETIPAVFINGNFIGGCSEVIAASEAGKLVLP